MSSPEPVESSSDSAIGQLLASLHKSTSDESTTQDSARPITPESTEPRISIFSPPRISQSEEAERNIDSTLDDFQIIPPQNDPAESSNQPVPAAKKSKKSKRKESKKEKKNKKVFEDPFEELPAEEPVVEQPVSEETVVEEPVITEPAVEELVVEQFTSDQSSVEQTLVEEPSVHEQPVEEPSIESQVEEPVSEKPLLVEQQPIEELTIEDPIVQEPPNPDHSRAVETAEHNSLPISETAHIDQHPETPEIDGPDTDQGIDIVSSKSNPEELKEIDPATEDPQTQPESDPPIEAPEEIHQNSEDIPVASEPIPNNSEIITPEEDQHPVIFEAELIDTPDSTEEVVLDQITDLDINPEDEPSQDPISISKDIAQDTSALGLTQPETQNPESPDLENQPEAQDHPESQNHPEIEGLEQEDSPISQPAELEFVLIPQPEETEPELDNNTEVHTPAEEILEIPAVEHDPISNPGLSSQSIDQQDQVTDISSPAEADQDIGVEILPLSRPQSVAEIVRSINEKSAGEESIQPEQDTPEISSSEEPLLEPLKGELSESIPEPPLEQEPIVVEPVVSPSFEEVQEIVSRSPILEPEVIVTEPDIITSIETTQATQEIANRSPTPKQSLLEPAPIVQNIEPVALEEPETLTREPPVSEYVSTVADISEGFVTPPSSIQLYEQVEQSNVEELDNISNMAQEDRSHIASQLSDALALFNSFDESIKSLVNTLQSKDKTYVLPHDQGHLSSIATPSTAVFQVPYPRNASFHGHFSLLSRMLGMWRPRQRCRIAVAGLGGFGKTELVVEFVHRAKEISSDTSFFWLSPDDILSKELPVFATAGPNSLLVVDSDDRSGLFESSSIINHLRNFQGTVILISRNGRDCSLIARPHEVFEVRDLELDACLKVFWDHLEVYARDASTEQEMQQVIESLGFHPRAIIQVAKVINSMQMSVSQFHEIYSTSESFQLRLFGHIDPYSRPDHDNSVIGRGIFDLRSFRKSFADQSRLFYQIYYLGGKAVPSSLVTTKDPLDKHLLMLIVNAHFMIIQDTLEDTLSIHPMVYLSMRKALSSERSLSEENAMLEERKWYDQVILALASAFPAAHIDDRKWWNDSFAHLLKGYNGRSDTIKIAIATIYSRESAFFKRKGVFIEALKMASSARDALPSPVPSQGLVILQDQITLLDFLAKYREVHELLRGLTMEAGHPGNLWKKSMMAKLEIADCANRYDSAIEIFRQVRTAGEAANVDKLDLANATNDLSMALMHKGKYAEAAAECKKALAERSLRLGSSHTDTLSSSHNLAEILHRDGKFEESIRHVQDAIRGREAALGAEHPETVQSKVLAARIQISKATTTGEFDEAESILTQAMEILSAKLSPSHPIVMTCQSEIAQIMFARGEYDAAETMNQTILAMRSAGPWLDSATHPDTMTSRNQLVEVTRLKDGCKAADNLSERCLTERTVVLTNGSLTGDDFHPDQLSSLHNRAVILSGLGQHLAALQKIDLALLGRKAILGERHPDYFISMTHKGEIMRAQLHRYATERAQTLDTIENLHKTAYEGLCFLFGSEHATSLQCATHMALAKRERGSPSSSEAEGMFRQIHCAWQFTMGDLHVETLKAKGRLAEAMRAAGARHHAEARKLWRDSCGGLAGVYGFDAHVTGNAYKGYEKFLRTYPDP